MKQKNILLAAIVTCCAAFPLRAEQFTTAAEVRPILEATRSNWVAVREYEGQDLLYFTHLLAWRCGLEAIYYQVNGGDESIWLGEECHENDTQPNALLSSSLLPFQAFPLKSIKTVSVRLVYDDGEESIAAYTRQAIMTP
ncbi:MAG TPA: hypothetical protein ENK83_08695 [Aliiroseovarius sp.]|nr:hypothetical protein [Aliiroseovarius sp.]